MISLCVIVKDMGTQIGMILSNVRPYFEEIIVVDTGSTDETLAVIRSAGVDVVVEPFVDFAHARNAALNRARGEWVFVLDTDEEIDEGNLRYLADLTRKSEYMGYYIPRYDYTGRCGWRLSFPCRLFRKVDGVSYSEPIYEEPVFPNQLMDRLTPCWELTIHHFGYRKPESILTEKRRLYTGLLKRYLEDKRDQIWVYSALAFLAAEAGDFNLALNLLANHAHLSPLEHLVTMAVGHARLLVATGQTHQALKLLETSLTRDELTSYQQSRVENARGLTLSRLEREHDAIVAFHKAIEFGFPVAAYHINLGLAQLRAKLQREGLQSIVTALRLNPQLIRDRKRIIDPSLAYQDKWLHRIDTDGELYNWFESQAYNTPTLADLTGEVVA